MALQVWWCSTDSAMALAVAVSTACCSGGSGVSAGDPCIALLWWPLFQGGSYLSAYDCLVRVVRYDWICRCIFAACTSEDGSIWYEAALIRFSVHCSLCFLCSSCLLLAERALSSDLCLAGCSVIAVGEKFCMSNCHLQLLLCLHVVTGCCMGNSM